MTYAVITYVFVDNTDLSKKPLNLKNSLALKTV